MTALATLMRRATAVRRRFEAFEEAEYGSSWSVQELALGLLTDVGDLAAVLQRVEGRRPTVSPERDRAALEHELADCLWVLLVLADRYDVDLDRAFEDTMDRLDSWLDERS